MDEQRNILPYKDDFENILLLIQKARSNVYRFANANLIDLYWQIGRFISSKVSSSDWGDGIVNNLADFIAKKDPKIKGFSNKIMTRCKSEDERNFYLELCAHDHLSSRQLERQIDTSLYERTKLSKPKVSAVPRQMSPDAENLFRDQYDY